MFNNLYNDFNNVYNDSIFKPYYLIIIINILNIILLVVESTMVTIRIMEQLVVVYQTGFVVTKVPSELVGEQLEEEEKTSYTGRYFQQ